MNDIVTQTDPRVGSVVGGRYRLTSRIAEGGMALVYRAVDERLGRHVAVKVMHPALSADQAFVERFRREAQSAASLSHPNIVTVHDWGRDGDTVYMVMELVAGESLRDLLDRAGRLSSEAVRHIVGAVAAALDHAHERGIVHRDVKPENVLLSWGSDGPPAAVKLVDFGIARALAEQSRLTAGAVVGTMTYIAPEQLHDDGQAGPRADVFALGVMAYELLTGRPAFVGDTPAAVAAARLARSVPSPGVSPKVDGAIARATALRPEDRYPTAGEFAAALESPSSPAQLRETVHNGAPPVPMPPVPTQVIAPASGGRRRRRRAHARPRRRWPYVLGAVLLAGAAASVAFLVVPRTARVPAVDGMSLTAARGTLKRAGLVAGRTKQVFHDSAEPGKVVGSIPGDGSEVRRGTRITVQVSMGPEMLPVPSVTGKTPEEASVGLGAAGFVVGETSEAHSSTVEKGRVAAQDPAEGTARRGSPVKLVVSKGPELVGVPDVGGKTADEARAALRAVGFAVATTSDWSDTVPEGKVVATSPPGGRQAPKGSTVTTVVSKGPKPFDMPNLVGMSLQDVRAKLRSLGLVLGNEYAVPGSGKPKGQVQGQNPPAGTDVRRGTRVDVYYAA